MTNLLFLQYKFYQKKEYFSIFIKNYKLKDEPIADQNSSLTIMSYLKLPIPKNSCIYTDQITIFF